MVRRTRLDQRAAVVLHVAQHLGDRVALDDVLDLVAAVGAEADVHGVGVAEEVVQSPRISW